MKTKKVISKFIVSVMALGMLTGCGSAVAERKKRKVKRP